jgi:hypothetical protein
MHALGGYFNVEAWSHWAATRVVQRRIAVFERRHGIGEHRRVQRFPERAEESKVRHVPVEERAKWVIDVDGLIDCWK